MGKKDFTANTEKVHGVMDNVTADPAPVSIPRRTRGTEPTMQDIQTAREIGKTQGRAGMKAIRINMAFTPEVHDYIRTMSRARGESVTAFTNYVFQQSMANNADLYDKAKAFVDSFNVEDI